MQIIATDIRVVIIGLGLTGMSCARYLASRGQVFSVVDSRQEPPALAEFKKAFAEVKVSLGGINDEALKGATLLVISPGVALQEPAIQRAIAAGAEICGDIDLFCQQANAPIVAITGSNGKSTVTTLVGEMARAAGKRVAVGGNIGIPVLELLNGPEPDFYVLELSSFQLERVGGLNAEVATVLNVSADHMDRYPNLQAYHRAKHRIFMGCRQVVVNRSDSLSRPLLSEQVTEWSFGLDNHDFNGFGLTIEANAEYLTYQLKPLMPVADLKIVGRHNIENALAALALGSAIGLKMKPMVAALKAFKGLDHRCQYVTSYQSVRFYNDSKGTNVGASIAAMKGLAEQPGKLILIAGGVAKEADFSPLKPVLSKLARGLVVIGEATSELKRLCADVLPVVVADNMIEAVAKAWQLSEPGDAVLLSPACASFDMFDNYQQRGDAFTDAALALSAPEVLL